MCQVLRQFRYPERRRNITAVLILLVLISAAAVPGCASLGLNDSLFSDASVSPEPSSTIRSQSSTASDDFGRDNTSSVEADYRPLRGRAGSKVRAVRDRESDVGDVPVTAGGHSFVQRRARLGRPVLLPGDDKPAAKSADASKPLDLVPTVDAAANESSGLEFGNTGWQSIRERSSIQEPATTSGVSMFPQSVPNVDASIPFTDQGSLPSDPEATVNAPEDQIEDGSSASEAAVNKEPTVFDQLRRFYAPRREETPPERVRKTTRRWPDPFGLLRERETETEDAVVGAVSPLQQSIEPEASAIATGDTSTPPSRDSLLHPLIAQLEHEVMEWEKTSSGKPVDEVAWRKRQTDLRMLYLIDGRSADSIRVIESLPEEEQEFWQSMMLALESYRRGDNSTPRSNQLAETLDYVRTASRQLQPLSTLRIRRLNFCNRIDGFGALSVFPVSDFNAGQPLLLYAEVENYKSELTSDGQHRSVFAAMIEFVREGETEPITSRTIRLPEIEDLCAARRTDYFQSYELTVPSLLPGKYKLRLRVRDQFSQQTATSELPFDIRPLGSEQ